MLHQVSGGAAGNIQDMRLTFAEAEKYNKILFELLGSYTNKTPEQVMADATRDLWLTADEAKEYGIIDNVIINKKKQTKK
jgi:ATP-dependent Clp protease protease subunit